MKRDRLTWNAKAAKPAKHQIGPIFLSTFARFAFVSGLRACEQIAVVQAFRPAVSGRPKGLHYISERFVHRLFSRP